MNLARILLSLSAAAALSAATVDEGLALKQAGDFAGAEAAFSAVLATTPGDAHALAERATVRGWQKKYDAAIADWRAALALSPQEADWHAGLARVLYWKGDRAAALAAIDQALKYRPRDAELWELKGDIARADRNRALATTAYREADRLEPRGRAAAKLGEEPWEPTSWRVDLNGVRDDYSALRSLESGYSLSLGYRHRQEGEDDHAWNARAVVERLDHFSNTDWTYGAEGGVQVYERLEIHAGGAITPGADFEPAWRVGGGIELLLAEPVTLLLDVRHSEYRDPDQQVLGVLPGLRVAPLPWLTIEGRLVASASHLPGTVGTPATTDHTTGWLARVALDLGRFHPYVGYARGEEPEPPLPVARTSAIWGGLVYELDRTIALRVDAAYEDRVDTYRRTSLGGGISVRF